MPLNEVCNIYDVSLLINLPNNPSTYMSQQPTDATYPTTIYLVMRANLKRSPGRYVPRSSLVIFSPLEDGLRANPNSRNDHRVATARLQS